MHDRKVIIFSSEAIEPLIELMRETVVVGDQSNLIRLDTVKGLTDSIYNHLADDPLVILVIVNEGELCDFKMLASLLQRVDLILFLKSETPSMKRRSYRLRPRLIIDNDDDLKEAGLLIKGILAKKKTNEPAPDSHISIGMDTPERYMSLLGITK